jgi:hypothetical protein
MNTPQDERESAPSELSEAADRQQLDALLKDIAQSVQAFGQRMNATLQRIDAAPILQWFAGVGEAYARAVMQVAPTLAAMSKALKELPPRLQEALVRLGNEGWFFDPDMGLSELWTIEALISKGESSTIDALLMSHFTARMQEIEDALAALLPKRAKFFRSAFAAHRRTEFELAIPVFLAQADGICLEITKKQFFMRGRGSQVPATAAYVQALDPFLAAFLSPLRHTLPINASPAQRQRLLAENGASEWTQLNRHRVMHGESLDYDTELNSLKAMSLLHYVAQALKDEQPRRDQQV